MDRKDDTQFRIYKDIISNECTIINELTHMMHAVQKDVHELSSDTLEQRIQSIMIVAERISSIEDKRDSIYRSIRREYGLDEIGDFKDLQSSIDMQLWEELDVLYRTLKISTLQFRSQLNILVRYLQECESRKRELLDEFFPKSHDYQYTRNGNKDDHVHAGLLCDWST